MAVVDLSAARARFEEVLLTGACVITRNPAGMRDATFDRATGNYTGAGTDITTVYEGPAAAAEVARTEQIIAGAGLEVNAIIVVIPWSSPEILIDDDVALTDSPDPLLVGVALRVHDVEWATWSLARRLRCQVRQDEAHA